MGLYDAFPSSATVPTPNGPIPSFLAPQFGITPPPPDDGLTAPVSPIPSPSGGAPALPPQVAAPFPVPTPAPPGALPDVKMTTPSGLPSTPAEVAKANAIYGKQQAQQAAVAASPEGKLAAAQDAQQSAIDEKKAAAQGTANVESAEGRQLGAVQEVNNQWVSDQLGRQQKQYEQDVANQKQGQAELDRLNNQLVNSKVDPSRYWHNASTGSKILMGIGVALGAIGQAATPGQQNNAALEIIKGAINQDVQLQLAQQEKLGKVIGIKGQILDRTMQITKDRQAALQSMIAGHYELVKHQIDEIAAKTQDPLAQAKAKELNAGLSAEAATLKDQAAQGMWTRAQEIRKQAEVERANRVNEGIAGGHLALASKQFGEQVRQFNVNRQDELDKFAIQQEQAGNAKTAAAAKDFQERGIFNPITGEPALANAAGQPMLDKARQLDQQAQSATDPNQQIQLKSQAQQLRAQAGALYGQTVGKAEDAAKIRTKLGADQAFVNLADSLQQRLENDPSILDRDEWARVSEQFHNAIVNYTKVVGEKPSSKAVDAMESVFGGDPSSVLGRTVNRKKGIATIDQIIKDTIDMSATENAGQGITSTALRRPSEIRTEQAQKSGAADYQNVLKGKTSAERGADAEPGVVTKLTGIDFAHPFTSPGERDPLNVENKGPATGTGLSDSQQASVNALIKGAANPDRRAAVVSKLVGLASSDRESIASGTLTSLQASDPKLYDEVKARLPKEQRDARDAFDAAGAATTLPGAANVTFATSTPAELARAAAKDRAVQQTLIRRATSGTSADRAKAAAALALAKKFGDSESAGGK